MKKILLSGCMLLTLISSLEAGVVINYANFRPQAVGGVAGAGSNQNAQAFLADTLTGAGGAATGNNQVISPVATGDDITFYFTQGGDFDGDGTNDFFSFEVVVSATDALGSSLQVTTPGTFGNANGVWTADGTFVDGESVTFDIQNVSAISNSDPNFNLQVDFLGFSNTRLTGEQTGHFYDIVGGTPASGSFANGNLDSVLGGGVSTAGSPVGLQSLTVTSNSIDGDPPLSGDWGVRSVAFQFEASAVTAIPEPSSLGFLALAGLGLIGRRRR